MPKEQIIRTTLQAIYKLQQKNLKIYASRGLAGAISFMERHLAKYTKNVAVPYSGPNGDVPIRELGFSTRVLNILVIYGGCQTFGDVALLHGSGKLKRLRGIGASGIREVETVMKRTE